MQPADLVQHRIDNYDRRVRFSYAIAHIWYVHARGYRVLEDGKVQSFTGTILKPRMRYGRRENLPYACFSARTVCGSTTSEVMVHRMQAYQLYGDEAFFEGMVVRHLNGNSLDNSAANIAIGTHSENMLDRDPEARKAHALTAARVNRKLTFDQVRRLKEDRQKGLTYAKLGAKYGVSATTAFDIVKGKSYKEK